jgi:hypothetical protein
MAISGDAVAQRKRERKEMKTQKILGLIPSHGNIGHIAYIFIM